MCAICGLVETIAQSSFGDLSNLWYVLVNLRRLARLAFLEVKQVPSFGCVFKLLSDRSVFITPAL